MSYINGESQICDEYATILDENLEKKFGDIIKSLNDKTSGGYFDVYSDCTADTMTTDMTTVISETKFTTTCITRYGDYTGNAHVMVAVYDENGNLNYNNFYTSSLCLILKHFYLYFII